MMKNIHGHTKIELTNVNTGEVKTVEDNNMVTNAIESMLNAPYENMPNTFSPSKFWDYLSTDPKTNVKNLTQGLLLFQDAIIEDPNQIDPPAGNNIVGLGQADLNYNGSLLEYGSYNSTESQLFPADNPKYVKYVWDFSTSQGNGVINCACLTTKLGGKMGYGVKSLDTSIQSVSGAEYHPGFGTHGYFNSQSGALVGYQTKTWELIGGGLNHLWVDLETQYSYSLINNFYGAQEYRNLMQWGYDGPIKWNKLGLELSIHGDNADEKLIKIKKSPLNKSHYELSNNLSYKEQTETINIPIPEELVTILTEAANTVINNPSKPTSNPVGSSTVWRREYYAYRSSIYITEKNLYIAFLPYNINNYRDINGEWVTNDNTWSYGRYASWKPGENLYILKIVKDTWETSYETIENTTDKIFRLPYLSTRFNSDWALSWGTSPFYITDKYIFLIDKDLKPYVFNKNQLTFTQCMGKRAGNDIEITVGADNGHLTYPWYLEKEERIILFRNCSGNDINSNNDSPSYQARIIELSNATISYHNHQNSRILMGQRLYPTYGSSNDYNYISRKYNNGLPVKVYGHTFFNACLIVGDNSGHPGMDCNPQIADFFHCPANPMLMTINNLPEPVEKTEEYTMKVTYELTWD